MDPNTAPPARPRRRWLKISLALVLLLALLLAAGPLVAAPLVRGKVETALEQSLDARASLGEFSFDALGRVRAGAFELTSNEGRSIAAFESLDVDAEVLAAVTGTIAAEAELTGLRVHVWRNPDGSWNLQDLPRASEPAAPAPSEPPPGERESEVPSVRLNVALRNARVVVHAADGTTELRELNGTLEVPSLEELASFALSGRIVSLVPRGSDATPQGSDATPGGSLSLRAELTAAHDGKLDASTASGSLHFELDQVALEAFAPIAREVAGLKQLQGGLQGALDARLDRGLELAAEGGFELRDLRALSQDLASPPIELPRAALDVNATTDDNGAGQQSISLSAGTLLDASYAGRTAALTGENGTFEGELNLNSDLGEAFALARAWLGPDAPQAVRGALGTNAKVSGHLGPGGLAGVRASVDLSLRGLAATDAAGRELALGEFDGSRLALNAALDVLGGSAEVSELDLAAGPIDLEGRGEVRGFASGEGASPLAVEVPAFTLDVDLDRLNAALASVAPTSEPLAGQLHAEGNARTENDIIRSSLSVRPDVRIGDTSFAASALNLELEARPGQEVHALEAGLRGENVALRLPPSEEGEAPIAIAEPRLELSARARLAPATTDVELEKVRLATSFIEGELSGNLRRLAREDDAGNAVTEPVAFEDLRGSFEYVPEVVGQLLAPWLPGELTGSERQPLDFTVNGQSLSFEPEALLSGVRAQAKLGVGRYSQPGLRLGGEVELDLADGLLSVTSQLGANEGSVQLNADVDLAPEGRAESRPPSIVFNAAGVQAGSGLSPVLGYVHPAFAGLDQLRGSEIAGLLSCELQIGLDRSLSLQELSGGWAGFPKDAISAQGRFALDQAAIQGSPWLSEILTQLGVDARRDIKLDPLEFRIDGGRVTYSNPWTWKLAGTPTEFIGSIGLDGSLDMNWAIPVAGELLRKNDFLKPLAGETLRLPLDGSLTRPRLAWQNVIGDVARKGLEKTIQDELTEELGLGELFGGGSGGESADDLLARADKLWNSGKKNEAAKLYQRLRTEFKISATYLLNKKRIKDRARHGN